MLALAGTTGAAELAPDTSLASGRGVLGSDDCSTIIHSLGAPCSQPPPVPRLWERSPVEVQPRKVIYQSAFKPRL